MDHGTASSSPGSQGGDNIISTVYVGEKYHELYRSEENTIRFVFRNFKSLPHKVGDKVSSEPVRCHGCLWSLDLYPGGIKSSTPTPISVYLFFNGSGSDCDHGKVRASFKFRFPLVQSAWTNRKEATQDFSSRMASGYSNIALRDEDILDSERNFLVDGDLSIEVDVRVWRKSPDLWTPPSKSFQTDMLHIMELHKYADVTFIVQGVKFPLHRNIIASRAPTLEAFCQDQPPNAEIEIVSEKVDLIAFRLFLRLIYGNVLPSVDELKAKPRAILVTADYCGCTTLKLAAETILVESLTADNAAELLVFADANSCALLKEAATDVFLANPGSVRASSGWVYVKESNQLMDELVEAMHSGLRDPKEDVNLDRMSVTKLRRKLDEIGRDTDGSRECLIKRLRGEQAGSD